MAVLAGIAGCSSTPAAPATLTADASICSLGLSSAPAGTLTFMVSNPGDEVAGFALLDGEVVLGELIGLAPEASRALVVAVAEGDYVARCIPATGADPITMPFTVGPGASTHITTTEQQDAAVTTYAQYVTEQSTALHRAVADFAAAFAAGTATLEQYDTARAHWIALRPMAASFSDLVPALDARAIDVIADEQWTGWQRIAADLDTPALTEIERAALGAVLVDDTELVLSRVETAPALDARGIAAGAVDLIDHASVSLGHPAEVRASIVGARAAFDALEQLTEPDLAALIRDRFDAAVSAASLDALAESLAQLQGVLA